MTQIQHHAGTFLLSDLGEFRPGKRDRISYISNATPVRIIETVDEYQPGAAQYLHKEFIPRFIKVQTLAGQQGYLLSSNVIYHKPQNKKESIILIKNPYRAIQGHYGQKLTRTQNNLIFGHRFNDILYVSVFQQIAKANGANNNKFSEKIEYDPFYIDFLPLYGAPKIKLVKEQKTDHLENDQCISDKTIRRYELFIADRKFLIEQIFKCTLRLNKARSQLLSFSLKDENGHIAKWSQIIAKLSDKKNILFDNLKAAKSSKALFRYYPTQRVDFFTLDKKIKDIIYYKVKDSGMNVSDLEMYVLLEQLKVLFFDYRSTKPSK